MDSVKIVVNFHDGVIGPHLIVSDILSHLEDTVRTVLRPVHLLTNSRFPVKMVFRRHGE